MTTLSNNSAKAQAHTNIALIKYWGKKDEQLIIPYTSSLSLTLDRFYTQTTVRFNSDNDRDSVQINGQFISGKAWQRVHDFLTIVRDLAGIHLAAEVSSTNFVPTAAGLASSASAFAALAAAASKAAGLKLSKTDLSRLARRGSGSACRSIFGGFVEWQRGTSDADSYAQPLSQVGLNDVKVIALTTESGPKPISSRQGMNRSVATSPYYPTWIKVAQHDLIDIKVAIAAGDFTKFGSISELNAMRMHALTLSADPDFTYFNSETLAIMNEVKRLRHAGIECYYTIDAGPNVKVIVQSANATKIADTFTKLLGQNRVTTLSAGPGVHYL
ncbi:diphosphomevalonate decarboxylase [Lentilactobacillus fungorum]|uniref:diphosphomevalonate decarboxylase n=1 Tax=Lentilactobacillus fungorum TaxID=2201250 RepID=A0ABQ3VXZ9_9LACO|nr:diphosphomevalonate decarboxylase [Lentilactobacillus fungorum]GHP12784.1 diphosphomevalonate decarboxylase [Lentilactobacillus fungorum]